MADSAKNRCNEGKLKREYVDKFTEIGIDISAFTSAKELPRPAWMSTYMEYKKFLETMHRQPSTREKKLHCWQVQMRKRYKRGNLKQSQVDLLHDIGVI